MHTLKITLKQHTPLIHFQHDQDGATLRASEVKPKLDRYILTQLGNGNYNNGKQQAKESGWLVGKGDHPALDYKMRIVATGVQSQSIWMKISELGKRDEIGRPLFDTRAYPQKRSLIMGNMGGRIKEELLNFVLFSNISLFIITTNRALFNFLSKCNEDDLALFYDFFSSHNFGNRSSKGFGSFFATHFNDIPYVNTNVDSAAMLSFSLTPTNEKDDIKIAKAYEDVFLVIGGIWKALKSYSCAPKNRLSSVLLNVAAPKLTGQEQRIPSPLEFKPYISKKQNQWDVTVYLIPNYDVIDAVGAQDEDFYDLIDSAISYYNKQINTLSPKTYNVISNIQIQ